MSAAKSSLIGIVLGLVFVAGCGRDDVPEKQVFSELVTVYKSPTCGCCTAWVEYLEDEGFKVAAINHEQMDLIKVQHGLTDPALHSCHTALVDGYVIEGHVPANDISRLLAERPAGVIGLTAPGMPMMSPGMNSRVPKDYAVLSFTESNETAVFSDY